MPDQATQHPDPLGNTVTKQRDGKVEPRLPHEHDESADSQATAPREIMKQAYDDVESGQENTDLRGDRGQRKTLVPSEKENK